MREKESIAIIGIGCRFPKANNPQEFWELLENGVNAVTEATQKRKDLDFSIQNIDANSPEIANIHWGSFLDRVDLFDANFFGILPAEAINIDPQQRILLEVAWEALEDAGQILSDLADTSTGVFIGVSNRDYTQIVYENTVVNEYITTATDSSMTANRISYHFDFTGPSLTINTACSSSLVAIDSACKSLWLGESSLALAGGVNIMIYKKNLISLAKSGMLSESGYCRAFDAQADGFIRSEGVGVVVLKPLSQAEKDGDRIYAVIQGSAINQNGKGNGITAPNIKAQEKLLTSVYENSGISPASVDYLETHGSSTLIGDAMEIKALSKVFCENRSISQPLVVGTLKTNIGHTEATSGVAGLIKVALSLHHREIPPNLHFNKPNPYIPFENLPLKIPQKLEFYPEKNEPNIAGISCFGFGGTNAHVIVQEYFHDLSTDNKQEELHLLTISAKTENSLQAQIVSYQAFLDKYQDISFTSFCYTVNARKSQFNYRLVFIAESIKDLKQKFRDYLEDNNQKLINKVNPKNLRKIAFKKVSVVRKEDNILLVIGDKKLDLENISESQIYTSVSTNQSTNLGLEEFWQTLGKLWLQGVTINWSNFYEDKNVKVISLPTYSFEHQSYWLKITPQKQESKIIPDNNLEFTNLRSELETLYIAPRNNIEEKIAEIWEEILLVKPIGVEDNFFALGGNSMLGTKIMARLENHFSTELSLPLRYLFQHPTIAQLSLLFNRNEEQIQGLL